MRSGGQRAPAILANGTVHMTPEEVQRHMMAQHGYHQQFMSQPQHAQANHQGQGTAQSNGQYRPGSAGATQQPLTMPPQAMNQRGSESAESPSTEGDPSSKRHAEASLSEMPNKKPKLTGKKPSESQSFTFGFSC